MQNELEEREQAINEEFNTLENDLALFRNQINSYLQRHELLDDLDKNVSQEEVDRLIAYEKGDAIRLNIIKLDGTVLIYKSATVNHIKLAIKDFLIMQLNITPKSRISWKHMWKKYCLQCEDGRLLLDNRNFIRDFSIHEGSVLRMVVKPIKRREKRPRQQNRKRFYNPNLKR